jgi:diguanylate cyclase (GGDEF)-like protein
LLSDDGTILAHSPAIATTVTERTVGGEVQQRLHDQRGAGSLRYISTLDGVSRFGSYQHLSQFPLTILVAQSEWDVQSSFRTQLIWNAFILVLVLIVLAAMGSRAVKANRLLNSQAMQDVLTGLGNRRIFEETIQFEFCRAARSREPISIILIDIDHFKDYNDCYGHLAGDECLRSIAHAIRGCIRRAGDLVARYGGEEFIVVLPGLDTADALALARTMKRAVHNSALPHARSARRIVTFSAGVASSVPRRNAGGWQTLVGAADAALYAAKNNGRDRIETAVAQRVAIRQNVEVPEPAAVL